ncbi:MAG: aminotransferase class V-fold PLP-dependent enzyme [Nitrospinaceae bacterium]
MDLELLRHEFPVVEHGIFLDHARVAPLSRRVREKVEAFAKDATEQGTANYAVWMKEVETTRRLFARLIGADPEETAFIKNTSEGISLVANGIDWKDGDNVVIPDIEFPANVYPWMNLERRGVQLRFAKSVRGRVPFEQIRMQVNGRTRVISVSSVECNSGFRVDLETLGAFCKDKGILFCVDAIQSLGALPMDVKAAQIDFLAADGHKWLLSLEGLGGFYISREALDKIHVATVGWDSVVNARDYLNYDFTLRPDARRFEEGSGNTLSIHALGAALSLFHEVGMQTVAERILHLGDCILQRLWKRNLTVVNSTDPKERSGIVAFTVPADLDRLGQYLAYHNITVTVRDGLVRLSPHFYNTEEEVDRFFHHLDEFLEREGAASR